MDPAVAARLKAELIGVVESGTARRAFQSVKLPDGTVLPVGGKTGTGDNRINVVEAGGQRVSSKVMNRTASFVFLVGDRFYGTIVAFVPGEKAKSFEFTSALPVQIWKTLAPRLEPLLAQAMDPGEGGEPAEEGVSTGASNSDASGVGTRAGTGNGGTVDSVGGAAATLTGAAAPAMAPGAAVSANTSSAARASSARDEPGGVEDSEALPIGEHDASSPVPPEDASSSKPEGAESPAAVHEELPVPEESPVPEDSPVPEQPPVPEGSPVPQQPPAPEESPAAAPRGSTIPEVKSESAAITAGETLPMTES